LKEVGNNSANENIIDYNVHGLVGIRLINPSENDASAVAKQLGPLQAPIVNEPDIIVKFVKDLPIPYLRYLGMDNVGFSDDEFFILKSSKKRAKVRIKFNEIGQKCEIVCESGLRSVPLLLAVLNLTLLSKHIVGIHGSAFVYNGIGILVAGWAKGGKTEALLSFAEHGAKYVGDEWIFLSKDGRHMYGVPENIRLWEWHFNYFTHLKNHFSREKRFLFKTINWIDTFQKSFGNGKMKNIIPIKFLREAMPAFKRQLNVQLPPAIIFDNISDSYSARVDKVFLSVSHETDAYSVQKTDPLEIARRMVSSVQYELMPFLEKYLAYKFAFPEKKNSFLEKMPDLQLELLSKALKGKEAYTVFHPYPVSFPKLFEIMKPYCE